MIAIIVATPLQLFNAMIIMRHHFKGEKADMFVLNIACDMRLIIEKYQKLDCINRVYYLDDVCRHDHNRFKIVWDFIHTTSQQRKWLKEVKSKSYTDLFSTWVGKISTWLYTKLLKTNPYIKVHFYEEGLGVYTRDMYPDTNGLLFMFKLLGYKFEANYLQDLYLYNPALATHNKDLDHKAIGYVTSGDIKYFSKVVGIEKIIPYTVNAIYFENDFRRTVFEGINEIEIINRIISSIGNDNLIVRMHPRNPVDKYSGYPYQIDKNTTNSWEDILAGDSNWDDMTLITLNSTAVFSPKLIYNKEPRIMILGKVIMNEYASNTWASAFWSNSYATFVEGIKRVYRNSSNVLIPENFNEMENILKLK